MSKIIPLFPERNSQGSESSGYDRDLSVSSGLKQVGSLFQRYIGIDYSGAETPEASLKGLRVYMADHGNPPWEVLPPPSPRKYWTRHGLAQWLAEFFAGNSQALVGIDHGFSFTLNYFQIHRIPLDWPVEQISQHLDVTASADIEALRACRRD